MLNKNLRKNPFHFKTTANLKEKSELELSRDFFFFSNEFLLKTVLAYQRLPV